ncbi:hypothetical protein OF83DRAFT_1205072, partial [Amylostereum chailletii]
VVNTPGVLADLSHVASPANVEGYPPPEDGLKKIGVSAPSTGRLCSMCLISSVDLQTTLATGIATHAIPVRYLHSTVPIVAGVFKNHSVFGPKSVTTPNAICAFTFVSVALRDPSNASSVVVPAIGGHRCVTTLPLLSQSSHPLLASCSPSDLETLARRVQFGGDEVLKAKDDAGSATLSMTSSRSSRRPRVTGESSRPATSTSTRTGRRRGA